MYVCPCGVCMNLSAVPSVLTAGSEDTAVQTQLHATNSAAESDSHSIHADSDAAAKGTAVWIRFAFFKFCSIIIAIVKTCACWMLNDISFLSVILVPEINYWTHLKMQKG